MRIWVPFFIVIAFGCSTNRPDDIPVITDYMPFKDGAWFVFAVDSAVTDQNAVVKYHYQLRIDVTSLPADSDGGPVWRLLRSIRPDSASQWKSATTWSARVSPYQGVVNDGNISYLKLSGILAKGNVWDGNEYNSLGGTERCPGTTSYSCDLYTLGEVGIPFSGRAATYSQSLTVVENNDADTLTSADIRTETYARATGLVDRQVTTVEYCQTADCYGKKFIAHGLSYHQTLFAYGGL